MTKLTDTQLIVLSSAAKHDGGLATRPINLHAAAAMKVASSLIDNGLVREVRAEGDAPFWREDEDGRFALKITKAGREVIGVEDADGGDEAPSPRPSVASASRKRSSKHSEDKAVSKAPARRTRPTPVRASADRDDTPFALLRPGSKQAIVVNLMMRAAGATLADRDDGLAAAHDARRAQRITQTRLRDRAHPW